MAESTSDEDSACRIQRLPPEMTEAVASYLGGGDLASLRATSKDLNSKVLREFSERCFSDKTYLLLWPKSMQTFVEISKHPLFSKSVKRVRFSVQQLVDHIVDTQPQQDKANDGSDQVYRNRDERLAYRNKKKMHDALTFEFTNSATSSDWQGSLLEALQHLKKIHTQGISIEVGAGRPFSAPCGPKAIQRLLGSERILLQSHIGLTAPTMPDIAQTFLHTVVRSRCPIYKFIHRRGTWQNEMYVLRPLMRDEDEDVKFLLASLREFEDTIIPHDGQGLRELKTLFKTLIAMPELQGLKISRKVVWNSPRPMDSCFDLLAKSIHIPNLRTIELDIPWISVNTLTAFIVKHRETLERVVCGRNIFLLGEHSPKAAAERVMAEVNSAKLTVTIDDVKM